MKVFLLWFVSITLLFSAGLTPQQLELAKAAGYSKSDIQKQLNAKNKNKNVTKKEQFVKNDINKNFFKLDNDVEKLKKNEKAKEIKKVKRYGALFFNNKNKLNPYSIPTPSNYNLNFGDKIKLTIYGSINQDYELLIDNNGDVLIPQLGSLQLIGLQFNEAKELIIEESKKAFPNSTNILVDMLDYASIQITVSGFVNAPGLYNLSSFSTIKDALISSGGILENGSYRNIYLKRDGSVKKIFDLYALVRYGDTSSDIMLQNGDVILVKPINKEVIISGDVNYTASFELKNNESYKNLINFAAGFKSSANKNAIKLKRYENNTLKVYTLNSKELYKMKPKNGDEVHVYSTSTIGAKLINIKGNVVAEGERAMPKDKKLSTLLNMELKQFGKKSYFKENTNYNYAVIRNDTKVKSFNLRKVLLKQDDIFLNIGDEIIIYKNTELQEKPYIYVNGNVVNKDKQKYDFYEGIKVIDLFDIVKFNNEKIEDDIRSIVRVDKTKVQLIRIENNRKISKLISLNDMKTFSLKAFDEINFFDYSQTNDSNKATIKGEVFLSGTYDISNNTTINDLISIAGGVTKKALKSRFELVRYSNDGIERKREILSMNLANALDSRFQIHADDEVTIFPIANWNESMYIELSGLVKFPGKYPIANGEKLSSVIQRAGGFLPNAFIEGGIFTREEVRLLQQQRLDESLDRIKAQTLGTGLSAKEIGETDQDKKNMLETLKQLEKDASRNKPLGRISLNLFYDLKRFKDSIYDIVLKDKDKLFIPSINDTVSIVGEVLNQNTLVYNHSLSVEDYISKSGGINPTGDEDLIYIVKANGEAIKYEKNFFWANPIDIFKGDTIVVPIKIDPVSDISFAKDVTQIVYQLAITAASLKTLGSI